MAIRFCIPGLSTGDNDGTTEAHAWQTVQKCAEDFVAGDHIYFKTPTDGSRAESATRLNVDGGVANSNNVAVDGQLDFGPSNQSPQAVATDDDLPTIFEGYKTTPGDRGMFRVAGSHIFTCDSCFVLNWDIDTGNSNQSPLVFDGDGCLAYRCVLNSDYELGSPTVKIADGALIECAIYGCGNGTSEGCISVSGRSDIINCYIELQDTTHGSTVNGAAIILNSARRTSTIIGNVISDNSNNTNSVAIVIDPGSHPRGSIIANNTIIGWNIGIHDVDGVDISNLQEGARVFYNNLFYNCGEGYRNSNGNGYAGAYGALIGNAYGSITSSQRTAAGFSADEITLTETPFINFAAGETLGSPDIQTSPFTYVRDKLSLNNTPGGGALVKGVVPGCEYIAGMSGGFTGGTGDASGFRSIGAIVPNPFPESSNVF